MPITEKSPHIDVVIPFGGNFDFLLETIESVIGQEYPLWHLYILDDNTQIENLQHYVNSLNDQRITLVQYETKLGIKKIFNESISTFKSQWGMILGADDLLEKNYLHEMSLAIREHPESVMIQPSIRVISSNTEQIYPFVDQVKKLIRGPMTQGVISPRRLKGSLIFGNWLYFGASVFRTDFLRNNRFHPDFQIAMDYELILRMVEADAQIVAWPSALFSYRRHTGSYSNSYQNLELRFSEELKIMKSYSRQLKYKNHHVSSVVARAAVTMRIYNMVAKIQHKIGKVNEIV
jgi:cellulose synthase/poly-beta-1,6-N-acetylglucosamine synthase-like glycosyltransferase